MALGGTGWHWVALWGEGVQVDIDSKLRVSREKSDIISLEISTNLSFSIHLF